MCIVSSVSRKFCPDVVAWPFADTGKLLLHDDADKSLLIYTLTLEIRSVATPLLDVAVYVRELSLMGAAWAVTRTKSRDLKWRVLVESESCATIVENLCLGVCTVDI